MIRIVLDTNVIVSALLQPLGPPAQILLLVLGGAIEIAISGDIYSEYEAVLRRPRFQFEDATITGVLRSLREKGFWVRPTERVRICTDAGDDVFVACACAAHAAYLVTGNLRHFPEEYSGMRVTTPRGLLDVLRG